MRWQSPNVPYRPTASTAYTDNKQIHALQSVHLGMACAIISPATDGVTQVYYSALPESILNWMCDRMELSKARHPKRKNPNDVY